MVRVTRWCIFNEILKQMLIFPYSNIHLCVYQLRLLSYNPTSLSTCLSQCTYLFSNLRVILARFSGPLQRACAVSRRATWVALGTRFVASDPRIAATSSNGGEPRRSRDRSCGGKRRIRLCFQPRKMTKLYLRQYNSAVSKYQIRLPQEKIYRN